MNEQTIFLIFLVTALAATLGLSILKAINQIKYKGDERWNMIQLKAANFAGITLWLLIVLIVLLPMFIDTQTTFTFQRISIFVLLYVGVHNLFELTAIYYFDKQL